MPVDPITVFGRGAIVNDGDPVPDPWATAEAVTIDAAALAAPHAVVERLHRCWSARQPVVVRLAVDPSSFRMPQSLTGEPWQHSPLTEPWFDRLHFLVWANNYDCRGEAAMVWWWARKASRLLPGSAVIELGRDRGLDQAGDVLLADSAAAWVDGGPRQPWDPATVGAVIHSESVDAGQPVVQSAAARPTVSACG